MCTEIVTDKELYYNNVSIKIDLFKIFFFKFNLVYSKAL